MALLFVGSSVSKDKPAVINVLPDEIFHISQVAVKGAATCRSVVLLKVDNQECVFSVVDPKKDFHHVDFSITGPKKLTFTTSGDQVDLFGSKFVVETKKRKAEELQDLEERLQKAQKQNDGKKQAVEPAKAAATKKDAAKPQQQPAEKKPEQKKPEPQKQQKVPEQKKLEAKPEQKKPEAGKQEVLTLSGGLKAIVVKAGTGGAAKIGKRVSVHYTGRLKSGKKFDSSRGKAPFSFKLGAGEVIKGWDIGVAGMKEGEKRILQIPAGLGYGKRGAPPDIPPNSDLEFDVELIKVH